MGDFFAITATSGLSKKSAVAIKEKAVNAEVLDAKNDKPALAGWQILAKADSRKLDDLSLDDIKRGAV